MQAGRLTQRVRIEQPVVTRNALGEEILGWTTFAEVWAEVRPLSTREPAACRVGPEATMFHCRSAAATSSRRAISTASPTACTVPWLWFLPVRGVTSPAPR